MTDTEQTNDRAARAQLYRKIAAVTAAVSRIPKNGKNTFHNYKYATESDITDGLRDLLHANGLAFLPPSVIAWERDEVVDNPKTGPRTRVQVQFALGCTESGETFTTVLWGEGQDNGDKGFYKAYTGAVKYYLMKTFLIATGDDTEQDHPQERQQSRPASYQPKPTIATNGSGKAAPKTAGEAEQRFFVRFGEIVGGDAWANVQRFLMSRAPKPTAIEGWIAAADAVKTKQQEQPAGVVLDEADYPPEEPAL